MPPIRTPRATPLTIASAYPATNTCRLLRVAVRSWPERISSASAGTISIGDGSSSLPAGIDARCQASRNSANAIKRQPATVMRPSTPGRRRALVTSGAPADSAVRTSAMLVIADRRDRLSCPSLAEFRLVGDHAADALPQIGAPLDEFGRRTEVVGPPGTR